MNDRSTLYPRLLEAMNSDAPMPDRLAAKLVSESASFMAAFDGWLCGPWEFRKERLYGRDLAYIVGLFLDGMDHIDGWNHYRDFYLDPYRDDDAVCCGDPGDCDEC